MKKLFMSLGLTGVSALALTSCGNVNINNTTNLSGNTIDNIIETNNTDELIEEINSFKDFILTNNKNNITKMLQYAMNRTLNRNDIYAFSVYENVSQTLVEDQDGVYVTNKSNISANFKASIGKYQYEEYEDTEENQILAYNDIIDNVKIETSITKNTQEEKNNNVVEANLDYLAYKDNDKVYTETVNTGIYKGEEFLYKNIEIDDSVKAINNFNYLKNNGLLDYYHTILNKNISTEFEDVLRLVNEYNITIDEIFYNIVTFSFDLNSDTISSSMLQLFDSISNICPIKGVYSGNFIPVIHSQHRSYGRVYLDYDMKNGLPMAMWCKTYNYANMLNDSLTDEPFIKNPNCYKYGELDIKYDFSYNGNVIFNKIANPYTKYTLIEK